jgi:hypothetical protein
VADFSQERATTETEQLGWNDEKMSSTLPMSLISNPCRKREAMKLLQVVPQTSMNELRLLEMSEPQEPSFLTFLWRANRENDAMLDAKLTG